MGFTSHILRKVEYILAGFFWLLFLLLPGCTSSNNTDLKTLSTSERTAIESLFSHLLLSEGGAYTLFGSKPMTFEVFSEVSEGEKQEFFSISSHPVIKNELNFFENWKIWGRVKNQYPMIRFLFFERKPPSFSKGGSAVFLVNIATTAGVLQKNYQKFRAAFAKDFDPLDVVFEMEDDRSAFWNTVLDREDLLAILLGYGEENGWFFVKVKEWEEQKDHRGDGKKDHFLASLSKQTPASNALASFDVLFPIPSFGCYAPEESTFLVKKYERERKMIEKIYRGKDFVQVTLDRLTSKDFIGDPNAQYKKRVAKELGIEGQL
jgi:hypothetical protein